MRDIRLEQSTKARKLEMQRGKRGQWTNKQEEGDLTQLIASWGSEVGFVRGSGCARGLTSAADEAAPQLLHLLSKKEREVYQCTIIYNYQVTWNNTPLWFRGLQDGSEACLSMINAGAAVLLPKATDAIPSSAQEPLLHLQSHQGEITTCLCCHLCFSLRTHRILRLVISSA